MDNRHSIGSKIQKYRKLKDMTQDELSKQSGIYLSTIKKYESGERNPKPDQLQKIAEALGISVTVFLDYDINSAALRAFFEAFQAPYGYLLRPALARRRF